MTPHVQFPRHHTQIGCKQDGHFAQKVVESDGPFAHAMGVFVQYLALWLGCLCAVTSFESGRPRIALDYGPRLVGLASSDIFGSVNPLCTLSNDGDLVQLSQDVLTYARREGAIEALVGLPTDSNGKMSYDVRNFNGNLCLDFATVLASVAGEEMPRLRVLLVDERYTTREAKARMKDEKIRASLDAVAAACLLQRYLEDEGEGALEAEKVDYPLPDELAYFDYDDVREYIRDTNFHAERQGGARALKIENERKMRALKEGKWRGFPSMHSKSDALLIGEEYEDPNDLMAMAAAYEEEEQSLAEDYEDIDIMLTAMDEGEVEEENYDDEDEDEEGEEEELEEEIDASAAQPYDLNFGGLSGEEDEDDEVGIDITLDDGDDADEDEDDDEEMQELLRLRAARRKQKGTLKRLRKKL